MTALKGSVLTNLKRGITVPAPIPSPTDIEQVLVGMVAGDDPFLKWCELDYVAEHYEGGGSAHRRPNALSATLWWAETVEPDGTAGTLLGRRRHPC